MVYYNKQSKYYIQFDNGSLILHKYFPQEFTVCYYLPLDTTTLQTNKHNSSLNLICQYSTTHNFDNKNTVKIHLIIGIYRRDIQQAIKNIWEVTKTIICKQTNPFYNLFIIR